MSDYVTSLVRTWVPVLVGSMLAWLAVNLGFVVDEQTQTGIVLGLSGVLISLYYAVVRWAAKRWPRAELLLGAAKQPTYQPPSGG